MDVAIAAACAGADVVARSYGSEHVRVAKSTVDFATEADVEAERAIMAVLAEHRPDDATTGEELGSRGSSSRRWLVDPLCGTLNFAAATPLFAVNVALVVDGVTTAAAVMDPIAGELYWTDGSEAFVRREDAERALAPRSSSGLVEVNCDGPLDTPFVGGNLVADPALRAQFGPRVISSTLGVVWAADARRAAYVSDGSLRDSVHFTAGIAICAAAGCVVSDLAGAPVHTGRGLIVSADTETHQKLLALVAPHLRMTTD